MNGEAIQRRMFRQKGGLQVGGAEGGHHCLSGDRLFAPELTWPSGSTGLCL